MDKVRVLRIVEYVGDRDRVEDLVRRSVHGTREMRGLTVRAVTIGEYPEILERLAGE